MMARILVVEDEKIVAKDIQRCLVRRGHDVPVLAASTEEAMDAAERIRPDLVLMDVTLRSSLDGIACASALRDRFGVPVVYLTANGDESTLERARLTRPVGYLLKPFHDQTLLAAIEVALQRIEIDRTLRGRESWLAAVLGSIVDGVVTIGPDGHVSLLNRSATRMTGIGESDAVGRSFSDVIRVRDGDDARRLASQIQEMLAGGTMGCVPLACTLLGAYDEEIPAECAVTSMCDKAGRVTGAVVVIRDMSERVNAEQALVSTEQKYRLLFENSIEGVFRSAPDGTLLSANPSMARLLGYNSGADMAASSGINLRDMYVEPAQRDEMIERLRKDGSVKQFEAEYRRPDGSRAWFSANLRAVPDAAGGLQVIEGTVMDITARKRAEQDLHRREAYLRSILDNSPYLIWLKDSEGRYIDLNRRLANALRIDDINKIRGKSDFDLYPPAEAARIRNSDIEVMKGGNNLVVDEAVDESGAKHYNEKYKAVLKDESGNVIGTMGFSRNITEMKEREEKLRKLSRAVEQSPSTIVITDTSGKIEYVNPRFSALTGYAGEEVIGKNPSVLKSGRTPDEVYVTLWNTIKNGGEWSGEIQNRKKNGELFWEYATISPIRDENGTITHFVGIKEDITKRKEVEAELARRAEDLLQAKSRAEEQARRLGVQAFELRKAREEALKASMMKSEFVANMSHEIRTPMNGVLGMAGLLLDTTLDDEQREYAEIIRTSGEALLSIVNDILDFSKIEAGKLELEEIDFQVRTTIDESMDLVSVRAREKGLELCCDVADDVPGELLGDPGRVRQILTNLLSNAVKFTDRGEIEASVTCEKPAGESVTLRFAIRDTGIGISESEREKLFRSFSQADGSTTRKYGGTGLGLVIAKKLVEMMGGEIGVRSEKGKGSEFWFTVNLAARGAFVPEPPPAPLRGARVLVVDDNATSRKILVRRLSSWEMRPQEAASGPDALAILRSGASSADPIRAVLIDMQMPGMDGMEVARCILGDRALGAVPFVLLTSAGQESVREAQKGGLKSCLNKPVRDTTLRRYLEQAMASAEQHQEVNPGDKSADLRREADAPNGGRLLKRVLVAEDNPVNQRVAVKMLEKFGCRADVVADGKEALAAVSRIPYDIVFMDCQMPEMDGFEATVRMRKLPGSSRKTLVVAMTANALRGDREKCIAHGMNDYLSKPVTQEALETVLKKWKLLTSPGDDEPVEHSDAAVVHKDECIDPEKIEELKSLAGEADSAWLEGLIRQFLADSSGRLKKLRDACTCGEAKTVEEVAHALKGSSATMGASMVQRIAERLQFMGRSGSLEGAKGLLEEMERELGAAGKYLEGVIVELEDHA
jgi:two-component system, sensor histidine kinase and response regulator